MLRIFLTSSHLSAILQSIYAESTKQEGYVDVLITDYPPQKKKLTELIMSTSGIHKWDKQFNYAEELKDGANLKPSFKKRFLRKFKQFPLIKNVYGLLLSRYMKNKLLNFERILREDFKSIKCRNVQLNVLTKTGLNEVLFKIYPDAEINYFEHGMGDYMYFFQNQIRKGNFYCVFNEEFSLFLKERSHAMSNKIYGYLQNGKFEESIKKLEQSGVVKMTGDINYAIDNRTIFILMESVEIYQVPAHFWTDYIDICLSKITDPEKFTFIIKPHPSQSFDAILITKNYFEQKGLKYNIQEQAGEINMSAEVMFYFLQEKTEYVFCIFSSSIYYLSKLYPNHKIKYYYGYDLFSKYIHNSPKQFVDIYKGVEPIIKNVLAKNCLEL